MSWSTYVVDSPHPQHAPTHFRCDGVMLCCLAWLPGRDLWWRQMLCRCVLMAVSQPILESQHFMLHMQTCLTLLASSSTWVQLIVLRSCDSAMLQSSTTRHCDMSVHWLAHSSLRTAKLMCLSSHRRQLCAVSRSLSPQDVA